MNNERILEIVKKIEVEVLDTKKKVDGLILKSKNEKNTFRAIDFVCEINKASGYIDGLIFAYRLFKEKKNNE